MFHHSTPPPPPSPDMHPAVIRIVENPVLAENPWLLGINGSMLARFHVIDWAVDDPTAHEWVQMCTGVSVPRHMAQWNENKQGWEIVPRLRGDRPKPHRDPGHVRVSRKRFDRR